MDGIRQHCCLSSHMENALGYSGHMKQGSKTLFKVIKLWRQARNERQKQSTLAISLDKKTEHVVLRVSL